MVVDTNVYISAFQFSSGLNDIFLAAIEKRFELVTSSHIRTELLQVLGRFGWSTIRIAALEEVVWRRALFVDGLPVCTFCRDRRDNHLFDTCVASAAEFLVSGDKDVLAIREHAGTQVITPAQFSLVLGRLR